MIWFVLDIICFVPGEELVQLSVVTKQRVDLKVNVSINSRFVGLHQLLCHLEVTDQVYCCIP